MTLTRVRVKIQHNAIRGVEKKQAHALELTAEAVLADIVSAQVIPFDVGTMQNDSTFVDTSALPKKTSIVTSGVQAARLYYHPEYNFQTVNNPSAGAGWFEPWIRGKKVAWVKQTFARVLRRLTE